MPLDSHNRYMADQQKHAAATRLVGSISLNPKANLDDHILASISVLNRHINGPIPTDTAQQILYNVVKYGYWSSEEAEAWHQPLVNPKISPDHFRRIYHESLGDMSYIGLIEASAQSLILTNLGKHALGQLVLPDN